MEHNLAQQASHKKYVETEVLVFKQENKRVKEELENALKNFKIIEQNKYKIEQDLNDKIATNEKQLQLQRNTYAALKRQNEHNSEQLKRQTVEIEKQDRYIADLNQQFMKANARQKEEIDQIKKSKDVI